MNSLRYIFLLALISTLYFQSCDENSFSQVVTIEIPEHEPEPVVLLEVMGKQERPLTALVSNSKGILDPDSVYQIPKDAELKLYRDGALYEEFMYFDDILRYQIFFGQDAFPDVPGELWKLEASIPGFNTVTVEQTMPPRPIIIDATYEIEGTIDADGYRVDELIVDIEDAEPGVTNYYGIGLLQVYVETDVNGDTTFISRNPVSLNSNDPLLSYSGRYGLVFTDEGFSNNEYQLRTFTYYTLGEDVDLDVELYQLTEDAWLYARSLDQYYNALDNPFAEPVTVHSNVDGGFGVFTLANQTNFFIDQ